MEFLSKEYCQELARYYFPNTDFTVNAYSEKYNWDNGNYSTRFNIGVDPVINPGNWIDAYGTIVRLPLAGPITGNFDIANTGEFYRKLVAMSGTTTSTWDASYFRVAPPGFSLGVSSLTSAYYFIPNGTVLPVNISPLSSRQGRFAIAFSSSANAQTNPQACTTVDPFLYVGYIQTSGTSFNDRVINTHDWEYLAYYADLTRSRGYVIRSNSTSMSETTSDNIHVFNALAMQTVGTRNAAFIGYRITPSFSDSGTFYYTNPSS